MAKSAFPNFSQWKQVFKVLKKGEKIAFSAFLFLALASVIFLTGNLYLNYTKSAPAYGGTYVEGVVGQPRFVNPIYGETNDTDRSLIGLIYSGLMAYDKDGKIITDLAKSYTVSNGGKTYNFVLKDNLFWQDGKPLTADDIIFTIKTIQNSDYKSSLRASWIGVEIEKNSDKSLTFNLKSPYNSFLENATVKIIPRHIWQNILPESFALSTYNLQPIGSGPYSFAGISQSETGSIKNFNLKSNHKYYGKLPYIQNISFQFFNNKEDLAKAANAKTINGFSQADTEKKIKQFNAYEMALPRYFAVFFNTSKQNVLSDQNIRQALNYAVDKQKLVNGTLADSPILPDFYGFEPAADAYAYDTANASKLLEKSGYKLQATGLRSKPNNKKPAFQFKNYLASGTKSNDVIQLQACLARLDSSFKNLMQNETNGKFGAGTGDAVTAFQKKYLPEVPPTGEVGKGTRQKLNELCNAQQADSTILKFTLTTINQPQLVKTANLLKDYWQKIGISVDIKTTGLSDLKTIIKTRNFDALLYGESLGAEPDPYPFWHSSQILDPGLNLPQYQNKEVDKLLKEARETVDLDTKQQDLEKIQNIIVNDAPALFLYNPNFVYWVSKKVSGIDTTKIIDPAKRFSNIQNWYIKTKRTWK